MFDDDDVIARTHGDGSQEVIGYSSGPAGEVAIENAVGMETSFDMAEPARFSLITLDRDADDSLLPELIGPDRARAIRSRRDRPSSRAMRLPRTEADDPRGFVSNRRGRFGSLRRGNPEPTEVARLAVTLSLGLDLDRTPLARATALLEVVSRIGDGQGIRASVAERDWLIAEADDLVVEERAAVEALRMAEPALAIRLSSLFRSFADRSVTFEGFADLLLEGSSVSDLAPRRASSGPSGAVRFDLLPNGRLTARGGSDGQWIRVFRSEPPALLAASPFRDVNGHWEAEAVVPRELGLDDLHIRVSSNPMPIVTTSFGLIRAAISAGRRAVEAHHVGDEDRSSELWLECAERWSEAGDGTRSRMARRYARGEYRSYRDPTLSEHVEAVLTRP